MCVGYEYLKPYNCVKIIRNKKSYKNTRRWYPRGVIVKARDCGIVVREFELQSNYYVHLRINNIGKGMNHLILQAMG